ncbi:MAG: helix-turn-helix transcriptional regulator [Clostridia bacterium]|nr:helix-turn-helix transcriptional regulator [Clostridia bacterium]
MDNIKTGNLIREARKEKGLTQLELAERLHVSDRAVSKWGGDSAPRT